MDFMRPILLALSLAMAGSGINSPQGQMEVMAEETVHPAIQENMVELEALDSLDALLKIANDRHRGIQKPTINYMDYIANIDDSGFDISEYGWDQEKGFTFDPEALLTLAQAEADMEILFAALATTYGPYQYFGGDAVFLAAKEAILADCQQYPDESGAVSAEQLAALLAEHLNFIQDSHFRVNGVDFHKTMLAHLYTDAAFDRSLDGRYIAKDGRILASVDGQPELDKLLRLALNDQGEAIYCPVVMKEVDDDFTLTEDLTLHYTDGSSETVASDPWYSGYEQSERVVDLQYNEGYPVLFCRVIGHFESDADTIGKELMAYAEQLKDEPVVILDLRSNHGGDGALPLKWLSTWSGGKVTTNSVGIQNMSEETLLSFVQNTSNPYYSSYEAMTEIMGMRPVNEHYMSVSDQPDDFVENENLLIILTGKNTSSSGEQFADAAMNVENVLIVGQNTYGMLRSNAYTNIELPESEIVIQLGNSLMFFPEGHFEEYVGFEPDIWVSGDAEEAVIRMLQNLLEDGIVK